MNLTKIKILRTTLSWQVIPFELEYEYDHEAQFGNLISFLYSILTPVYLPDFNHFFESVLDFVPIHYEIESLIFQDQHTDPDQYHTF